MLAERLRILAPSNDDIRKLLAAKVHIGTKNCTHAMSDYLVKLEDTNSKNGEDKFILDLEKFWDKLILAARIIVAVENPADVCVISARPHGKRAVIKYAHFTGASQLPDRFTPGTFTNQIQDKVFMEPRLLILTDPMTDHQALKESSYVNIPVIALCNTDCDLKYVDVAIPCNNRTKPSIALVYWLLARTVRRMRNQESPHEEWSTPVDLFYQRDPEDIKEEEEAAAAAEEEEARTGAQQQVDGVAAPDAPGLGGGMGALEGTDWGANAQGDNTDWADYPDPSQWPQENLVDPNAPAVDPNQPVTAGYEDPNAAVMGGQQMGGQQMGYDNAQYAQGGYQAPVAEYEAARGTAVQFPEHDVEHW